MTPSSCDRDPSLPPLVRVLAPERFTRGLTLPRPAAVPGTGVYGGRYRGDGLHDVRPAPAEVVATADPNTTQSTRDWRPDPRAD